jgi:MSHA biogenesis protein MshM
MYLEHFGLNSPPFKITPVTDFFFPGANRAEILEALIYAITESEGIIKITGEVGSGKTMLCRMLLERLPAQVESIYLANPSLSREEMLYAIADGLGLNLEGQRVNIIMQTLQNLLAQKTAEGKRVVVLVDEAHAMPLDTLEELRLLYNLQVGDQKLLQIVLFGQPELNAKLEQPNMRQVKDRILHHFVMLPLSQSVIESYLLFRLRTAGYRGPNVFSPAAVQLIGKASNGLMRRVNILADKSLLAAFVGDTHSVDVAQVQTAIRDSELSPSTQPSSRRKIGLLGAGIVLGMLLLLTLGWVLGSRHAPAEIRSLPTPPVALVPLVSSMPASSVVLTKPEAVPVPRDRPSLLQQRLQATHTLLSKQDKNHASIFLFYSEDADAARMERFLMRAQGLGKVDDIYLLPSKINGRESYRVLYGDYADLAHARLAMTQLPARYQAAFVPLPYLWESAVVVSSQPEH